MIKVLFLTEKNGECEREFPQGDHWTDRGAFIEIRDKEGKAIGNFNSAKVVCMQNSDEVP